MKQAVQAVLRLRETVFDAAAFDAELAGSSRPIAVYRKALQAGGERLRQFFEEGMPVDELIYGRTAMIDFLLKRAWAQHVPDDADAALVAVGGYGRGELHPASDIDILFLLGNAPNPVTEKALEGLLMFLWDIGLEPGHSLRTVEDCVREAEQDVSVITSLMEARHLEGPRDLFDAMRRATGPDRIWPSRQFFQAKMEEQEQRYHKFDDTAYKLEPNIKNSPGGLRDIQGIGWVAKRHFGAETMHDLVRHGFLTEWEYLQLMEGQSLLWKLRFALHTLTGRREDRLLFDYQRTLAEQFGYRDRPNDLAVEQMMQRYYQTVMRLSRLNEMLLAYFQEAILPSEENAHPERLNARFQIRNGFLEVTHSRVFQQYPHALLELFVILQNHPELRGVRATTIRLIREYRDLIDDHFRESIAARTLFMEILRQPEGITHALRRMNRYGILARYIPAFGNVVGRMQYDLYHVYTVDEHTLMTLRNIRRLMIPEHHHEFPLLSRIIATIPKPELLYLAALFHDIAKGRGGDHSTLGAQDALAFCQAHELSNPDCRLVAWLVEKHLVMSMTAQRRDIHDPEVIQAFAEEIADPVRLDYLYLLTVADSRATNPKRWNSWRNALLQELYKATRRALMRGLRNPQAQDEVVAEKQAEALRLLELRGFDQTRVVQLWISLNIEYFLHNFPDEIAWHAEVVLNAPIEDLPVVRVRPRTPRGGTEVFVYAPDHDHLFAITTAVLDQLGLNIMDARIITTDTGFALNSFLVLEEDGNIVADPHHRDEIVHRLHAELEDADAFELSIARRTPRQLKHFPTPTEVSFSGDTRNHRTVLRLATADRPGLLAHVGLAFSNCRIRLQNAKIATIGAETEDIFFITDQQNCPIEDPQRLACLENSLRHFLDGAPAPH